MNYFVKDMTKFYIFLGFPPPIPAPGIPGAGIPGAEFRGRENAGGGAPPECRGRDFGFRPRNPPPEFRGRALIYSLLVRGRALI